jgi:hypothetical protein
MSIGPGTRVGPYDSALIGEGVWVRFGVNPGVQNIQRESSGFGQILNAGIARIVQFGLRFYF